MPAVGELCMMLFSDVVENEFIGIYIDHPYAHAPRINMNSLKVGDFALIIGYDKGYYKVLTRIGQVWVRVGVPGIL